MKTEHFLADFFLCEKSLSMKNSDVEKRIVKIVRLDLHDATIFGSKVLKKIEKGMFFVFFLFLFVIYLWNKIPVIFHDLHSKTKTS